MRLLESGRFLDRLIVLYALVAVPLCRLLLQHEYGFLYPEVLVLAVLALLPCVVGALIAKRAGLFFALVLGLIVVHSTLAVHVEFLPDVRLRWIILGLAVLIGGMMLLMRQKFLSVLMIFLIGSLAPDLTKMLASRAAGMLKGEAPKGNPQKLPHLVYIVFDGQIGLEGFPKDIPACQRARQALQDVLGRNNFTVYPFAFSNYRGTRDSIPSILNNRLAESTGQYMRASGEKRFLKQNRLFEEYIAKGYAVRVYQSDYMNYAWPGYAPLSSYTYKCNSLAAMHSIRMNWLKRLRQILAIYVQTDWSWWEVYTKMVPARFHPVSYRMSPLAVREVWPGRMLADIQAARRKTLFFAHLMVPHFPYVYSPEGVVKDLEAWFRHGNLGHYREAEYRRSYEQYAEQVQFLARQLEVFFEGLRAAGLYDSATVIIHGDHGSRLRLLLESERAARAKLIGDTPECCEASPYDYVSPPQLQDLLNRFSTLLAVRLPGATQPAEVTEKGSVLYFLRGVLWPRGTPDANQDLNAVYLFDAAGLPRRIPLLEMWQGQETGEGHR